MNHVQIEERLKKKTVSFTIMAQNEETGNQVHRRCERLIQRKL